MSSQAAWTPLLLAAVLFGGFGFVGCGGPRGDESARSTPNAESEGDSTDAPSPPPVELTPVDRAGLDAALEDLEGHVVLVDFWATWCVPCVAQLPHTVEMAEQYRDDGLRVVTVSLDEASEADRVAAFLAERGGASLTNYISSLDVGPEAVEAFELPGGAVPHYRIYDAQGELLHSLGGSADEEAEALTPEAIEQRVVEALQSAGDNAE